MGRKPTVRVCATSCFDMCDHGPNMIVDGNVYSHLTRELAREVYAGIIPQPSADVLEIRDSGGNTIRVRKDQVARLKRQPFSLMPDGLPAALTKDEFRDLLAYLQSLK